MDLHQPASTFCGIDRLIGKCPSKRIGALAVLLFGMTFAVNTPAAANSASDQDKAASVPTLQDCEQCPAMVTVPAGSAFLGSEPHEANARPTDGALREVQLDYDFALARTEVTRGQFAAFVEASGYVVESAGCNTWGHHRILGYVPEHRWDQPGFPQTAAHPVVCVSFEDAQAYAKWLTRTTGKPYRLPSSTEFEYATRAGTRGPWFWGARQKDACEYANIGDDKFRDNFRYAPVFACDDGYEYTAPAGSYKPNAWGLHDMLGNAWEWTADCLHRDMQKVPLDGSAWLEADGGECDRRTPRGGGWVSGTDWVRAAAQAGDRAVYHSQLLGFRVARTLTRRR